jgi:hypothetical protein
MYVLPSDDEGDEDEGMDGDSEYVPSGFGSGSSSLSSGKSKIGREREREREREGGWVNVEKRKGLSGGGGKKEGMKVREERRHTLAV